METKNPNLIPQRPHPNLEIARWQFQSESDPYHENDSTKWRWQNYSDEENLIIEEAYCNKRNPVTLKDYEIDLKKLVQVSLQDKSKVRRVRRQEPSRFRMEIPEANILASKDQKTMNEAFGTVQQFLEYVMKRTPEAYTLYQRLKAFPLDSGKAEFEDIVHQVLVSIEKGAEIRSKIIKARTSAKVKDFILEATRIRRMIENSLLTLRDFLLAILKTYTMETFLCYWVNELLRSEDWEEINILTPFLVCLVYTFKLSDYTLKSQNSQKTINNKFGFVVKHKLYLYRGAALTQEQLLVYNPKRINHFSWNAVTSTTRDRNVAKNFMNSSVNSTPKFGVIFFIEIDFDSLEDYHGMIDISRYSHYPREQEVILAPGTVFKLLEISLIENDNYEIRLKVTKNIEETQDKKALLGVLQDQAIIKDQAFIEGLPSQKGFRMLDLLKGNKLIRKLEVRNSGLEEHIMEEIEKFRLTTNIQKQDIRLVDNTISASNLNTLVDYFSAENLNNILTLNKVRFAASEINSQNQMILPELALTNETIEQFRENGPPEELWKRLKNEVRASKVNLSIQKTHIQEGFFEWAKEWKFLKDLALTLKEISLADFDILCQAISSSSAKTLTDLSLKFNCSDEGFSLLQKAIMPLESLQNLSLECDGDSQISDKGLESLSGALKSRKSLQHLSLHFQKTPQVSDKGIDFLCSSFTCLTSLQHLSLQFKDCGFSNEVLKSLKESLTSLKNLVHFSCSFSACSHITIECLSHLPVVSTFPTSLKHFTVDVKFESKTSNDIQSALVSFTPEKPLSLVLRFWRDATGQSLAGLKSIFSSVPTLVDISFEFRECKNLLDIALHSASDALIELKSLRRLSLILQGSKLISNEALNSLQNGLNSLTSLQHLSLSFSSCEKLSDEGLSHLKNGLIALTSLKHLYLDLGFAKTANEAFSHLENAFLPLVSLQHLSLNFSGCTNFGDEELNHLGSGFKSLTWLQHLALGFKWCKKISDQGLIHLHKAIVQLVSLEYLALHFNNNEQISDKGLSHLSNALKPLICLRNLTIELELCQTISDEGFNHLQKTLASLISLQELKLNYRGLMNISDKGFIQLASALKSLINLRNLDLDLNYCELLSDKALDHLKDSLISLPSLQYLSLDIGSCLQVSNKGLNHLGNALMSLLALQHLSLNFNSCNKISDEGLDHLKSGLKPLESLQYLSLNFEECKKLSDEGLNHLKSGLISLTCLQNLSLNFEQCNKISDQGLNHLRSSLKSLVSLQKLSLQFQYCYKITDEGVNHLNNAFTSLGSLKDLNLDFSSCKKISEEAIKRLESGLTSLACLKYFYVSHDFDS